MKFKDLSTKTTSDLIVLLSMLVVFFMITTVICGTAQKQASWERDELKVQLSVAEGLIVDILKEQLSQPSWGRDENVQEYGPQFVTVKSGDWLSKYAQKYLGDPHRWPEIWELNPHIENPDLIYPGQVVRIW